MQLRHRLLFFFFKQKTAYEISRDWSSDVCSSDLDAAQLRRHEAESGRLLPGRLASAGAAQHGADGRRPLVSLGRDVTASPLLARGEQVDQLHGHPDHHVHVTVEVHLTSYISAPRVVTVKGILA